MKSVALLTPYAAPIYGGISTFISGIADLLHAEGQDVSILTGQGRGTMEAHSNLGVGGQYVRNAARLLNRIAPEIVHCHAHWYTLAAGAAYLKRRPSSRLVFSFHTTPTIRWKMAVARLLRKAHAVTFVSSAQLRDLRPILGLRGDTRVLRPAIHIRDIDPAQAAGWATQHGLRDSFPLMAFAGPLEYPDKVKGVVDLVSSIPRIRERFPSVRLVVLGDGGLRSRVVGAASTVDGSVRLLGFVDNPLPMLAAADLYCHISYQEGLPLAILEAMSVGRCVLASPVGGIPEVIDGSNGMLVDGGPEAISDAVCGLAADKGKRTRLGDAARETIRRGYTWSARRPELMSVYGVG